MHCLVFQARFKVHAIPASSLRERAGVPNAVLTVQTMEKARSKLVARHLSGDKLRDLSGSLRISPIFTRFWEPSGAGYKPRSFKFDPRRNLRIRTGSRCFLCVRASSHAGMFWHRLRVRRVSRTYAAVGAMARVRFFLWHPDCCYNECSNHRWSRPCKTWGHERSEIGSSRLPIQHQRSVVIPTASNRSPKVLVYIESHDPWFRSRTAESEGVQNCSFSRTTPGRAGVAASASLPGGAAELLPIA
jgi:hypothetical protein